MNPSDRRSGQDLPPAHVSMGREKFLLLAESYLKEKRFREALLLARERIDLHPEDADARLILGISLFKTGVEEEALSVFEEIREDILRLALVLEFLGDIYSGRGDAERARACYQSLASLEADPRQVLRLRKKIDALGNTEKEPDRKLSGDVSENFKTLTMAELYLRQGHLDAAVQVLEEILRREPGNAKALGLLRKIKTPLQGKVAVAKKSADPLIEELTRWLDNAKRSKHNGY